MIENKNRIQWKIYKYWRLYSKHKQQNCYLGFSKLCVIYINLFKFFPQNIWDYFSLIVKLNKSSLTDILITNLFLYIILYILNLKYYIYWNIDCFFFQVTS